MLLLLTGEMDSGRVEGDVVDSSCSAAGGWEKDSAIGEMGSVEYVESLSYMGGTARLQRTRLAG